MSKIKEIETSNDAPSKRSKFLKNIIEYIINSIIAKYESYAINDSLWVIIYDSRNAIRRSRAIVLRL